VRLVEIEVEFRVVVYLSFFDLLCFDCVVQYSTVHFGNEIVHSYQAIMFAPAS